MYIKASLHRTAVVAKAISVLCMCALLLMFSKSCSDGAKNGIKFCLEILVPSLFPFMAVSGFLINSGLSGSIGKPFGKLTKALFGLNGSFAPIIILSMLGGYPVGARGISTLKARGSATGEEAKRAAMFCVCAGPGFIINFIGVSLYQNKGIGLIILASQVISVFALGIFFGRVNKSKDRFNSVAEQKKANMPFSSAIVKSVIDASKGMLSICAFVIIFSAFTAILDELTDNAIIENSVFCLLEVCEAVNRLSKSCPVEAVAFAVGFGGLCVHFQIFSALENTDVGKGLFFFARIIQGVITAILTHLGLMIFPIKAEVFSSATVKTATTFGGSAVSGIAVVLAAICFLLTLRKQKGSNPTPL